MSFQARPWEPEGITVRRYGPPALTVRLNAEMSSARLNSCTPRQSGSPHEEGCAMTRAHSPANWTLPQIEIPKLSAKEFVIKTAGAVELAESLLRDRRSSKRSAI